MTSGIYRLTFRDGSSYIGKSIDMERRWEEHQSKMLKGTAAAKVQWAYNKYGLPKATVLVYCHPDHIDLMETLYIAYEMPVLNSASTVSISNEDACTLSANIDMLSVSTGEHIRTCLSLREELGAAEERIKILTSKKLSAIKIKGLEESLKESENLIQKLRQELKKEKSRSWWSRLFG